MTKINSLITFHFTVNCWQTWLSQIISLHKEITIERRKYFAPKRRNYTHTHTYPHQRYYKINKTSLSFFIILYWLYRFEYMIWLVDIIANALMLKRRKFECKMPYLVLLDRYYNYRYDLQGAPWGGVFIDRNAHGPLNAREAGQLNVAVSSKQSSHPPRMLQDWDDCRDLLLSSLPNPIHC